MRVTSIQFVLEGQRSWSLPDVKRRMAAVAVAIVKMVRITQEIGNQQDSEYACRERKERKFHLCRLKKLSACRVTGRKRGSLKSSDWGGPRMSQPHKLA